MKQISIPYILVTTIALIFLLLSQGIRLGNTLFQTYQHKSIQFEDIFRKALLHSIFLEKMDNHSFINIDYLNSMPDKMILHPNNITDLWLLNNCDNIWEMIENSFLLNKIEPGLINLPSLDSLIQDRASHFGKHVHSTLTSVCKKTTHFQVFDKKTSKTRLSKFLK